MQLMTRQNLVIYLMYKRKWNRHMICIFSTYFYKTHVDIKIKYADRFDGLFDSLL